jgi:hypothetical protein
MDCLQTTVLLHPLIFLASSIVKSITPIGEPTNPLDSYMALALKNMKASYCVLLNYRLKTVFASCILKAEKSYNQHASDCWFFLSNEK